MTETTTNENEVPADEQQAKGTPPGVRNKDISDGHSHEGPAAPVVVNTPPAKVLTAEEKAAAAEKEATDKATKDAADAAAKAEANKTLTAEEVAAAEKKAADEAAVAAGEPTEYATYNDESADSIVGILKEAKIPPSEAKKIFSKAVDSGKAEDIDLKTLQEKLGKEKAALVMIGVKQYHETVGKRNTEIIGVVHAAAGGAAQFKTVSDWAATKEATDPTFAGELAAYRQMMGQGKTGAKLAAAELVKAYNADPANKSLQVRMTTGETTNSDTTAKGLTRAEYIPLLTAAEKKGDRQEVARLNAARLAGKKAGI